MLFVSTPTVQGEKHDLFSAFVFTEMHLINHQCRPARIENQRDLQIQVALQDELSRRYYICEGRG